MDEEFTAFVHTTLTCLNDKMDNLIANQANYERKLSDIEERVTFEFISNSFKEQDKLLAVMEKVLDETTRNLQNTIVSIARFEEKLIRAERPSHGFNICLPGACEVAGEDCIKW